MDYFLVIGRQPPQQQSLVPMRRLSRSNSQTIQPISDLSIVTARDSAEVPDDYSRVTDFLSSQPVNLNPGFMRTPVFLCECRQPKRAAQHASQPAAAQQQPAAAAAAGASAGSAPPTSSSASSSSLQLPSVPVLLHPITGVDVISLDRKEAPKAGYVQLPGMLSRGSFKGNVAVCVERDSKKSPIIDLKIIAVSAREGSLGKGGLTAVTAGGAEGSKAQGGGGDKADKDKSALAALELGGGESCPPDYVLVDRVLTTHKGKDFYLCYKVAVRRAVEYMAYEAFVLDRYPPTDHADQALEAQGVAMLCFPRGMILSADMSMPSFMTFVITQADGSEMYGAALIFYERITDITDVPALYPMSKTGANGLPSPSRARSEGEQQVWCPKCLCLLSHHPYYDVYKVFLNQLYRIAVSPSSLPIERYIANFFYDVPVPSPLYPIVRFAMGHEKLSIRQQQRLGLPHQHVSLMPLFKCLSVANIIAVFQHVLAEGKLVLVSSSYTLLTPVAEAIRALLYPFRWQCLTGDHMVMTRSGWRYLFDIHREFEAAKLRIAAGVEGAALPVIEVSSFNVTTSAMEWKPVVRTQCFPAGRPGQRLFRMQGEGMDVVATADHRMLVGHLAKQQLVAGSFVYQTVDHLPGKSEYRKDRRSQHTAAFEHHPARVVVRCGVNRQPAYRFVIKGMEEVCDGWWKQDQQLGFLRFLGFWLGDGNIDVKQGRVVIGQRRLKPLAFLIDLLDALFPHWWYRNVSATDAAGLTFNFFIRCPPLYEYLRVMAVGPAGYMPLDPEQLRKYPHFDHDVEVVKAEAASSYVQRTANSTWTEAEMLNALSAGPVRRPCYKCRDASGDRLTCSGQHCHDVKYITRAHPMCVGRTAEDAFERKQRVGKKSMGVPWPWFCPHPQCQLEAAAWAAAHPSVAPSASSSCSPSAPASRKRSRPASDEEDDVEEEGEGDDEEEGEEEEVLPLERVTKAGRRSSQPTRYVPEELDGGGASDPAAAGADVHPAAVDVKEEETGIQAATTQVAAIVWNGGVWDIDASGHWHYRKRWLGPNVASSFSNLSQAQAVALLEGFNRADGVGAHVQFDIQGKPTGKWLCTSSSMPLIHHLQLIAQLAGARVDLRRHAKQGKQNKSGPAGRTLTHKVDHWLLALHFNKVCGAEDVIVAKLAKPRDVSTDIDARGYYQYKDDGHVYDLTVADNGNFLTQRLSLKRIRTAATEGVANTDVQAQPVYVGNCVFIPILPTNLAYTIRAPVPFIVGLHRSFMDEIRVPPEVLQVDLDRNRITMPQQDPDAEKQIFPLPQPLREQLEQALNSFVDVYRPVDEHSNNELDSYTAPLESTDAELASFQELNIRLTFMRVIIRFLGRYRRFCILREEDEEDELFDLDRLFDRKSFFSSFPPSLLDFARQLTDTQGFADFILNRVQYTSRMEELLFFDYCCALTRDEPGKKDAEPMSGGGGGGVEGSKPVLSRSNTSSGLDSDRKRFSRSGNRTLTEIVQPSELYRTGSLTIEKIEDFAAMTPSVSPFLYPPGQEKPYIAPGPDESDCPPTFNYASFPTLDLDKFPASARVLLAEQQAYAAYMRRLEKKKAAEKKAAKAAAKAEQQHQHGNRPHTPGRGSAGSSSMSTPIGSPVKNRGNLSLDHIPSSPRSPRGSSSSAASTALTHTSLQRIVLALYTLLNTLTARVSKAGAQEKKAGQLAGSIYEIWFALFVSECEKERARRIEQSEAARFAATTTNSADPLTAVPDTREDAFSLSAAEVHVLPAEELPLTYGDLLSIYTELHTMAYKGAVLPNESILRDISLFCLRAGLSREFQELYRLLSTSVPFPGVDFFLSLARVGVSVLPGHECSASALAEKARERKAQWASSRFDFPLSLETECVCSKCGYSLSGEEIAAGWLLSDRLQATCPLCETATSPSLLVTMQPQSAPEKHDLLKASQLRSTIHAMTSLSRGGAGETAAGGETAEVQDLGDSGSIDIFAGSPGGSAAVTPHDYLHTVASHPFLFWNLFWYCTSRGLNVSDYGQLPFHFLFGETANAPSFQQPKYRFSGRPYRPWRVYQEGAIVVEDEDRTLLPASLQSSRSASPSLYSATQSLINDTLRLELPQQAASSGAEEDGAGSASVSTSSSPQINGHRMSDNGEELIAAAGSVSLGPSIEREFLQGEEEEEADDKGGMLAEVMSPLSLTGRALSLTVNVDGKESEAETSTSSVHQSSSLSQQEAERSTSKISPTASDASGAAQPPLTSGSTSSITSRRDIKTWSGIISIMLATSASSKQRPVPRAVHEILRARKARRSWSREQKEADADAAAFNASMYRQLSLLLLDPTDPVAFAADYKLAISSLNQLIETHKKAVELLDAQVAQLMRTAASSSSSSSSSTATATSTSSASGTAAASSASGVAGLKSPTSASASSADGGAAAAGPITRSPSSGSALSALLSPTAAGAIPPNLPSELQREVDAARKKRNQLIATLQEAVSLRSEIGAADSPPVDKYVAVIPLVRRLFAHDPTAQAKKTASTASISPTSASDATHNAYASLVEDVLLNEVPALEDVLSQSSQNPYYTLDGFTKFCAKFVTRQEREEREAERTRLTALLAAEAAAVTVASSAPSSPVSSSRPAKPSLSLAYKYCAFWQTARRWKIGYEQQEKQRTIKKEQQEMLQNIQFDTAKAIFLEYLAPQADKTQTAAGKKPAAANGAVPAAAATAPPPAAAAAADSSAAPAAGDAAPAAAATVSSEEKKETGEAATPSPTGTVPSSGGGVTISAFLPAAAAPSSSPPTSSPLSSSQAAAPATPPRAKTGAAPSPPRPVLTVAGFLIDGAVFHALQAALGDVQPQAPKAPSTPTSASAASSGLATSPSNSSSGAAAKSSSAAASAGSRHRVAKALFDDVLLLCLQWLQSNVFDSWVTEVKESEHSNIAPLASLGLTSLHQHGSAAAGGAAGSGGAAVAGSRMQGQGSSGPSAGGRPPFSKIVSSPASLSKATAAKAVIAGLGVGKKS